MTERSANRLLQSLAAQDMHQLAAAMRSISLPRGATVYQPDSDIDAVWFPESGVIGINSPMLSGAAVQTSMVGKEGAVGVLEVCGAGRTYSRAGVEVAGQFHRIPAAAWCECYDRSADLRTVVQAYSQLLLIESRQLIACQARHQGSKRLAWLLLSIQDSLGGTGKLALTQDSLADMLGAQRTTVTAWAVKLKDKGAIDYRRGTIEITDREHLERAACECHATTTQIRLHIEGAMPARKLSA